MRRGILGLPVHAAPLSLAINLEHIGDIREKETFRELEREAIDRHLAEMRTGRADAVITGAPAA